MSLSKSFLAQAANAAAAEEIAQLRAANEQLLAALREMRVAFARGDGDCTPYQLRAKRAADAAIARAEEGKR